jgi:beta-phosphoglucomutase-like phosphatase (HAD superfamily)
MIKAILYDLDGVLVDATEWHYESLNEALKQISGFEISRQDHISTFNGLPTMKKLDILFEQKKILQTDFDSIWSLKQ